MQRAIGPFMELDEIKQRVESGDIRLADALARALPKFHGLISDDVLIWCSNELQGYPNGLDYYQRRFNNLPQYRVINGVLKVMLGPHRLVEIIHPLAERNEYFLSASIGWLEDFYSLPGELSIVDMPELTSYIGKQSGGNIICQCTKGQLLNIITSFKKPFLETLDQVIKKKEKRKATSAAAAAQNDSWSVVSAAQFMKGDDVPRAPGEVEVWGDGVATVVTRTKTSSGMLKPPAPPLPDPSEQRKNATPPPPLPKPEAPKQPAEPILKSVVRRAPQPTQSPPPQDIMPGDQGEQATLPAHFMRALIPTALASNPNPSNVPKSAFKLIDPTAVPSVTSRTATGWHSALSNLLPPDAAASVPPDAVADSQTEAVPALESAETTGDQPAKIPTAPAPTGLPRATVSSGLPQKAPTHGTPQSGLPRASARPTSPTAELPMSQSGQIKERAMEIMRSAYAASDWVLPTWELTLLEPAQRELNKVALSYLLKKGWARAGKDANVFLLTQDGAVQVENLLGL